MKPELLPNIRGIYKINFPNEKCYIGMSNQIKTRIREHKNKDYKEHPELPISKAINKYGILDVEILEELPLKEYSREEMAKREIFWIKHYDSTNKEKGYNLSKGGDGSDFGWNNHSASLSKEDVYILYDLLLNTELTYAEIIEKFNGKLTIPVLERLNAGHTYYNESLNYPLRKKPVIGTGFKNKNSAFYKKETEFYNLVDDLINHEEITFKELEKKYDISTSTLNSINNGKIIYDKSLTYPIRKNSKGIGHRKKISKDVLENIKKDLEGNELSFEKIAKKYNMSSDYVSCINKGVKQKQENWDYPIRKKYLRPGPKKS